MTLSKRTAFRRTTASVPPDPPERPQDATQAPERPDTPPDASHARKRRFSPSQRATP